MLPWLNKVQLVLLLFGCLSHKYLQAARGRARNEPNPYPGTFFGNRTLHAAIIVTDPHIAAVLGRDFHKVPQGVNGSAAQNAQWRIMNAHRTIAELPFPVEIW